MPSGETLPPHDADSPPQQVLNQLFAAGLDVHQTLLLLARDTEPARRLHSALAQLDETIVTVLRSGLVQARADGSTLGRLVLDTFGVLAHGLAGNFDLDGHLRTLARHATDLPTIHAAAFALADAEGSQIVTVVAPDQIFLRELARLRPSPSWDTCVSGQPQTVTDLTTDIRWPLFAARANAAGYQAVHTVPLRQQHAMPGALTLLSAASGALQAESAQIARGLADLATIGLLLHQAASDRDAVTELAAEPARVHQAEGILAERHQISLPDATAVLAAHARQHGLRLPDLAAAVIGGTADLSDALTRPRREQPRHDA